MLISLIFISSLNVNSCLLQIKEEDKQRIRIPKKRWHFVVIVSHLFSRFLNSFCTAFVRFPSLVCHHLLFTCHHPCFGTFIGHHHVVMHLTTFSYFIANESSFVWFHFHCCAFIVRLCSSFSHRFCDSCYIQCSRCDQLLLLFMHDIIR